MAKIHVDIDKVYRLEDIKNIPMSEYISLVSYLDKLISSLISDDDLKILNEANEFIKAPYYYAINPYHFELGSEKKSAQREAYIQKVIKKSIKITEKFLENLPPNTKILYDSIKEFKKLNNLM